MRKCWMMLSLASGIAAQAQAAGHLVIERAWIRAAPPGAMMLAGYATLKNDGDAPFTVTGADSTDFGEVSLHQSVEENGVERMRPLGRFDIAPGVSVEFSPAGKHFMLMRPAHAPSVGDRIKIHIDTETGPGTTAEFAVADSAPTTH